MFRERQLATLLPFKPSASPECLPPAKLVQRFAPLQKRALKNPNKRKRRIFDHLAL